MIMIATGDIEEEGSIALRSAMGKPVHMVGSVIKAHFRYIQEDIP